MSTTSSMHLMLHDDPGNLPSYQHHHRPPDDGVVFVEVALTDDARLCISGTPAMLDVFVAQLTAAKDLAVADAEQDWQNQVQRSDDLMAALQQSFIEAKAARAEAAPYRPETADADTAEVPS